MRGVTPLVRTALMLFAFGLTASGLHAQKAVVGVAGVQTAAQNISCDGWDRATGADCNKDLASGFQVMLETAIVKSGKMDVMERGQLDAVVNEQAIAQLGLTDSGGQVGGLQGVDYLIYGMITKFGTKESGFSASSDKGVGSLFGGRARQGAGGGVKTAKLTTEMAVDLKVTEVASGKIVLADSVGGEVEAGGGFSVGGIESSESSADPFADVQRVVAAKISEKIVTTHFPIKVIQTQGDGTLILNYGNVFFAPGDQLTLFEVGESFVDPDTGEVLGAEETELGRVQITVAETRFSKARLIGEPIAVSAGTVLKRPVAPVPVKGTRKRSGKKLF